MGEPDVHRSCDSVRAGEGGSNPGGRIPAMDSELGNAVTFGS